MAPAAPDQPQFDNIHARDAAAVLVEDQSRRHRLRMNLFYMHVQQIPRAHRGLDSRDKKTKKKRQHGDCHQLLHMYISLKNGMNYPKSEYNKCLRENRKYSLPVSRGCPAPDALPSDALSRGTTHEQYASWSRTIHLQGGDVLG